MEFVRSTFGGLVRLLVCCGLLGSMLAVPVVATEVEPAAATEAIRETATQAAQAAAPKAVTEVPPEAATQAIQEAASKTVTEETPEAATQAVQEAASKTVTEETPEATTQAAQAAAPKAVTEVPPEAATQAVQEAASKTVTEVPPEAATQAVQEAASKTVTEVPPEAATQVVQEAASKTATEVPPEAATQAVQETASKIVTEVPPEVPPSDEADEEAKELCDLSTIDEVFKEYENIEGREQIKRIQLQLKVGGYDPGKLDGLTGSETDAAFARLCVDYKVAEYFEAKGYSDPDEAKRRLAGHLVKLLFNPTINLSAEDCGCSRDFSARVYGFYPYLLAGGETKEVDFSLLDWIGFHALVLDKAGEIQDDLQWRSDNGNVAGFIHQAHKHRVKVDVTFYASDWEAWDFRATGKAAKNIAAIVNQKFHETDLPFWRRILRLTEGASKVSADGVNLYFVYNANPGSGKKMVEIVTRVFEELEDTGSEAKLNLMLGLNLPDIEKQQLADLKSILVGDAAPVDKVLIFLPKNTTEARKASSRSKKALRQAVENAFSGNNRITVLRKIVPIITPTENDFESLPDSDEGDSRFDDDLVYLKDNFAGVGLWPMPLKSSNDAEEIGAALIKHYRARDGLNYIGEKLGDYAPQVCKFVCPNRLFFYIGLGLLVGILVIFAVLALLNCRLRVIYQRYFLLFLALFLSIPLILVISLVCDPAWEKYVDRVVNIILLLFIAGFVWGSVRKAVRPKLP